MIRGILAVDPTQDDRLIERSNQNPSMARFKKPSGIAGQRVV